MKKTIIALLALGSVAMGADYSGTYAWGSDFMFGPVFTFTTPDSPLAIMTTTVTGGAYKETSYNPDTLTPNVNMNAGSWTASVMLINPTDEHITIGSLTLDSFIFNGSGAEHTVDTVVREVQFELGGDLSGSTVVGFTGGSYEWNTEADAHITFDAPVTIANGGSIEFTITAGVSDGLTNGGSYVGLKGMTFSTPATPAIPEPTTATLSLLALAGLAARRRRR